MSNFVQLIRAEEFPEKITWQWRDSFALLIIPLIFLNGAFLERLWGMSANVALGDSIFRGILFAIVCYLYKDMLYAHWQKYKRAFWRSSVLVIVGAVLLQVVVSITRQFLPIITDTNTEQTALIDSKTIPFFSLFMISLGPLFTALLEDIVFRYTLLQKLFITPWLWRVLLVLFNSILFGLIHYHNFDGNVIATISFMTAGLFLNLIYLWTRNIWHVLLIHFFNNAVLSLGALILLKFLHVAGAV
ncbi:MULTISPECIES: type II CAAX endopeptidase family protein [unclassified Acinetobacter]|uniref:CPBP family intramembrane glutamic endopeptidase n=1 Tax=unclassified Acinetobacter TaxID=196816 RepID=UPI002575140A|nr:MULTISPECIES: type II CAAX endopeptidase family protein [unclassified Acinetobacter]MDM1757831.1 CPBP family intramembrane metalloprotease [Acinetobacter sp. 256-1]MDM1762071.1 CPBP family intramembrane metalloprotease [Acinetobacter sp. 251-1]